MKLKEHIEKFEEYLLEEKVNKPTSKKIGILQEHIEKFDESLLDEKVNKPTSKGIGMLQEHIARFEESLEESPTIKPTSKDIGMLQEHIARFEESLPVIKLTPKNNGLLQEHIEGFEESLPVIKSTSKSVNFTPIEQLQLEILKKDKIIESLKSKSTELTDEVLNLEKEKSTILEELSNSKWLENNIASTTKKIYEDKIKKMSYVDSTELIPTLIEVSRKKQGNEKLNWGNWLEISENRYLLQINEDMAKQVFEGTNDLIDRAVGNLNRFKEQKRTRAGDAPTKNYSLTFTGDTASGKMDYVTTDFDPDAYELWKGFTVSYWVRTDEITGTAEWGRRNGSSNERFFFGIHNARTRIGVGKSVLNNSNAKHGMTIGEWNHFVVTYNGDTTSGGNGARLIYLNGELHWPTDSPGNTRWNQHTGDNGGGGHNIYFGARNNNGNYTNGWAHGIDEVAIFDEEKDSDWVEGVYNAGTDYDHRGSNGLVGYWRFNKGDGIYFNDGTHTHVEDFSGNGNHGTFVSVGTVNHSGTGTTTTALPTWEERE